MSSGQSDLPRPQPRLRADDALPRRDSDYLAFLRVLQEVQEQTDMPVAAYCLMPNHWHLVLWPRADHDLARFMQRVTISHVRRWVEHRRRVGYGSVYQGRYK